tara:strand:- start:68 stop:253 length:186 start_codon:yes stop_codon:yes gene_type:complete
MVDKLSAEDVFGGDTFLTRLTEELDAMYPPLNPNPTDDMSVIMYRAGQRSVVEYIKAKSET